MNDSNFSDIKTGRTKWLAWPTGGDVASFVKLCRKIAKPDPILHVCRGETLRVLVKDLHEMDLAERALQGLRAQFRIAKTASAG